MITNKLFLSALIATMFAISAFAQDDDDYNKNEFYAGYLHTRLDDGDRRPLNGGEVAYTRNISRFIGIKGNATVGFGSRSFNTSFVNTNGGGNANGRIELDTTVIGVHGGVRFKDNASKKRLKPFAHILGGIAYKKDDFTSTCTGNCTGISFPSGSFSNTGFSGVFGGGLDIRINDKIDLRVIQADYNPITTGGGISNNFRFGAGIIFK